MERTKYIAPEIELTELDNQISLELESAQGEPPVGPGDEVSMVSGGMNNDLCTTKMG
ncbi:MAG: hypothetical protein RBT57_08120 [Paludibacter sp.]|jgi:hypothetical protein|nr:hypothetical protein [Paludibacter sp.]